MTIRPFGDLSHSFSASLGEAHSLLDSLKQCLNEESTALKAQDMAAVKDILLKKADLLRSLEHNANQRSLVLEEAGYSSDNQGVKALLKLFPAAQAAELQDQWQNLEEKLNACKSDNALNGKIVQRAKRQVETLLSILRGQSDNAKLYNATGTTRSVNHQHPLGRA